MDSGFVASMCAAIQDISAHNCYYDLSQKDNLEICD